MRVKLYTTYCPKCEILKRKLQQKSIIFEEISEIEEIIAKGFMESPVLEVDGEVMKFHDANDWINNQE